MSEISKHPEMGTIISSIRKIAKDVPCEDCVSLKDDLNAAKSREKHWKEKHDKLKEQQDNLTITNELMKKLCGDSFPIDLELNNITEWKLVGKKWLPFECENQITKNGLKINIEYIKNEIMEDDDKNKI